MTLNHNTIRVAKGRIESVVPSDRSRLFLKRASVDLPPGALILPGFVDTHCHLMGLGLMSSRVALRGARSAEECAGRVAERVRAVPPGEWIEGFGWNQEEWKERRMPDRRSLDAVAPDNPVILQRIDSHACWLNTRALQMAGIKAREIPGGSIEIDEDGSPTGILIDNAMKLAERARPSPAVDQQTRWHEASIEECLRLGITEVHDMNVEPDRVESMTRLAESGGMRLRCQVFLSGEKEQWRAFTRPIEIADHLRIVGVKYFADGALGSRGALLLEPYSDAPETYGIGLLDADELVAQATVPVSRGFAIATHAIGDAANRIVLDAYATLRQANPDGLLRIEHAQIVHPQDVPRFTSLGVIPAMQPTHCTSDATMAVSRLGESRCRYAYGWRALRETGVPILGGSDFPIESADPIPGIRAFHFREPVAGGGAWYPDQCISRSDSLDAYTRWAPLGIPGEVRRGALSPDYDADLVVLSGDPFDDPDSRVLLTLVAGEIVYRRE